MKDRSKSEAGAESSQIARNVACRICLNSTIEKVSGETGADCENVATETHLNRPLNARPSRYSIRNGEYLQNQGLLH